MDLKFCESRSPVSRRHIAGQASWFQLVAVATFALVAGTVISSARQATMHALLGESRANSQAGQALVDADPPVGDPEGAGQHAPVDFPDLGAAADRSRDERTLAIEGRGQFESRTRWFDPGLDFARAAGRETVRQVWTTLRDPTAMLPQYARGLIEWSTLDPLSMAQAALTGYRRAIDACFHEGATLGDCGGETFGQFALAVTGGALGLGVAGVARVGSDFVAAASIRPSVTELRAAAQIPLDRHFAGAPEDLTRGPLESVAVPISTWGGGCFVAETPIAVREREAVAIESLDIGTRVTVLGELDAHCPTKVDPKTWRLFTFKMRVGAQHRVVVKTLRPKADYAASLEGASIPLRLSIPEMNLHGEALLVDIDPVPTLEQGPGCLVLTTYKKSAADDIVRLELDDGSDPIGVTQKHPIFSLERNAWVQAGSLRPGESLRALQGVVRVLDVSRSPTSRPVYNIEVERAHSYHVGNAGVLAHNNSQHPATGGGGQDFPDDFRGTWDTLADRLAKFAIREHSVLGGSPLVEPGKTVPRNRSGIVEAMEGRTKASRPDPPMSPGQIQFLAELAYGRLVRAGSQAERLLVHDWLGDHSLAAIDTPGRLDSLARGSKFAFAGPDTYIDCASRLMVLHRSGPARPLGVLDDLETIRDHPNAAEIRPTIESLLAELKSDPTTVVTSTDVANRLSEGQDSPLVQAVLGVLRNDPTRRGAWVGRNDAASELERRWFHTLIGPDPDRKAVLSEFERTVNESPSTIDQHLRAALTVLETIEPDLAQRYWTALLTHRTARLPEALKNSTPYQRLANEPVSIDRLEAEFDALDAARGFAPGDPQAAEALAYYFGLEPDRAAHILEIAPRRN